MRATKAWIWIVGVTVFLSAGWALACEKDKAKPCSGAKTATTVADDTVKDGRSESAVTEKNTPCAHSRATTVAETSPAAAGCKAGCKGCAHAKSKSAPCSASKEATTASATPCGKKCGEDCAKNCPHAKARLAAASAGEGCSSAKKVNAILASMPTIRYRVGDETTSCPKHAKAIAGSGGSLQYVVGDEAFASEDEAVKKLAEILDHEVAKLQAVEFVVADESYQCPMTAKRVASTKNTKIVYRVAGFDFDSRDEADKMALLAKEAVGGVKMTYKVGDESFCCDKMASAKAKETKKSIVYQIGDSSTPCAVTAKRLLAEAKLRAVVETAAEHVGS